jgi:Xaa-Pro aminopeptidase
MSDTHEAVSTTKAGHDTDVPAALVEFMRDGWLDRAPDGRRHPQVDRLRERRAAVARPFAATHCIVPAGGEKARANDTNFRFRPATDFAYLVGDGEPGAVAVLEPDGGGHRTVLFVQPHNRGTAAFFTDRVHGELWVGRHRGVDESAQYYGVDACRPLDELGPYVRELQASGARVRSLGGLDATIDAAFSNDDELATYLSEARLIKDDYEIQELRTACAITKRAFEDAIVAMRDATGERAIEAAFWSRARVEANDVGYLTIAAAGQHACTLHWTHNDGALHRGELLLLDAGVECDSLYTADVTRTLPISGTFTPEQREIYTLVWEAQRAAMEAVKPGNDFLEPNRRAMAVLARGLIDLGIVRGSLDEVLDPERQPYRRYTLHNVSHMLGLDVHDCARARAETYRYGALRAGMALTVEPALYFQPDDATVPEAFRGIGVRIEDDVVVTPAGYENLSSALPSQPDEVEAWIAGIWSRRASSS